MRRQTAPGDGQAVLEGMPAPPPTDYETWRDTVWPSYLAAARTGHDFLCWHVAEANDLPEPAEPRYWPRLIAELQRADVIRFAGYGDARDGSACKRWQGTRSAIQGRAA
ncbi:MAG TPA: hypothetical protein VK659_14650 [Asanoa sp.]|nr:hypothetical protein [Asanoa sp.]